MAMGVSFSIHYCHGQVDSISFFEKKSNCCCSKDNKPAKCCFDENYKYEIKTDQLFSSIANFNFKTSENHLSEYINTFSNLKLERIFSSNTLTYPPPISIIEEVPIRLLQSIFRL